jgi:hypothetical protein
MSLLGMMAGGNTMTPDRAYDASGAAAWSKSEAGLAVKSVLSENGVLFAATRAIRAAKKKGDEPRPS